MISSGRKILQQFSNFLMALLFCSAVLLSGSEFVGFPWGPLAGAACWLVLGIMALILRGDVNG